MKSNGRSQSRHEYSKPELKQRIDDAMAAYINAGKAVQRIAPVRAPEPLDEATLRAISEEADDEPEGSAEDKSEDSADDKASE